MKELTVKQQRIWDLKRPIAEGGQGKTYTEIAAIIGISQPVVSKTLTVIYKKLGIKNGRERAAAAHSIEVTKPEAVAAAIDAASDPTAETQRAAIARVNAELKAAGIPDRVNEALVRRMRVKYGNAITIKKQQTTNEILQSIDEEIHLISSYIDDKVASEASLRDLGMVKAALLEKRQLLKGEPTQIISDHDRKKLHDYLPVLAAEMARRGIATVEGTVTEKVIGP